MKQISLVLNLSTKKAPKRRGAGSFCGRCLCRSLHRTTQSQDRMPCVTHRSDASHALPAAVVEAE